MANAIIFLYLVIFPFGQLFKLVVPIQPIDIISGLILAYVVVKRFKWPRYIIYFLISSLFSYLLFAILHPSKLLFTGLLYFLRLTADLSFIPFIRNNYKTEKQRFNLLNQLLVVITVVGIFGWLQYLLLPDLRFLKLFGWDDHLFRLVGTFLDPTYTGIILVIGFLIALGKKSFWLTLFFLITVAFTYSRASYLALGGGLLVYGVWQKKYLFPLLAFIIFGISVILLPRPSSEGVQLERTQSIYGRFRSYEQGLTILKTNPLFGIGFNNYCYARQIILGTNDLASHACSGSDSSVLDILVTTGVVGFSIFIGLVVNMIKRVKKNIYGTVFIISSVAVFTHSFFSNSLFYAWVLNLMAILLGLATTQKSAE
jgi:O-antigen ligase